MPYEDSGDFFFVIIQTNGTVSFFKFFSPDKGMVFSKEKEGSLWPSFFSFDPVFYWDL
jgi:hypothetical protein